MAHVFDNENLEALVNNTDDLLWSIDKNFKLVSFNQAFDKMVRAMSGHSIVKGKSILEVEGFNKDQLNRYKTLYERALQGETFTFTEHIDSPVEFWSEISFYPIRKKNEIIGVSCYSHNITERKIFERKLENSAQELLHIKNKLERSEKNLKEAQKIAHLGSWSIDFETGDTIWSDEVWEILGIKETEDVPYPDVFLSLVHPEDLKEVEEKIRVGEKSSQGYSFHCRIVRPSGALRYLYFDCRYILDKAGKPLHMHGIIHDVTEKKKAEDKVSHSEQRLNQAQQIAHIGSWEVNFATNISKWSDEAYEIYGLPPGEHDLSIESWMSFVHPDDLEEVKKEIEKSRNTLSDYSFYHRIIRADGAIRYVRSESRFEFDSGGNPIGLYGVVHDVTEQKKIEEKLIKSEQGLKQAQAISHIGNWEIDFINQTSSWSDEIYRIFGLEQDEVLPTVENYLAVVHPDDIDDVKRRIKKSEEELKATSFTHRIIKKNGEIRIILSESRYVFNKEGIPTGLYGIVHDITESKLAEENIRIAKERYDIVAKATNDSIWDWDLEANNVVRTGDGLRVLFGYNPEVASKPNFWEERVHPDDFEQVYGKLNSFLQDPNQSICDHEYRFRKADGQYAYVYDKGYILRDEKGKAIRIIGATQDITHRKESELLLKRLNEKLQQRAEELAVSNAELEQFAYIASHDLQEPLRMITSFLTQLEKKYKDQLDDKAKQYIFFATDGAIRMRKIILDLLEYSRVNRRTKEFEQVDMNELLSEAIQLNQSAIEESNAIIETKKLPQVYGNKVLLRQLFQNLIGNALKYRKPEEQLRIMVNASESSTHWQFSIADNGIGIEPQFFDKIFILFQRLHGRENYPGTGIGLAICKKIIEKHKGKIWVESVPDKGSTFYFTISK